MLANLTIKNIVLIESLTIDFQFGLCALTGETGAGKSILLDSLGLAIGGRSDSGLVRKGEDQAQVTAEFHLSETHPVFTHLKDHDIDAEDPLVLRRSINKDGRSRAFINDQPVSVSLLKSAGDMLIEIHGQFETQSLLNPKIHRSLLDDYAGLNDDLEKLNTLWALWKEKQNAFSEAKEHLEKARAEEEYLRQAVEDLDRLSPEEGEEEKLSTLRERLMKREQILESLNTADQAFGEAENILGQGLRTLERIGGDGGDIVAGAERAVAEIQEVLSQIQTLSSDLEDSEYSLSEIDDRLFALKNQARKHDCTVDALPEKRDELAEQLNTIDAQDDILTGLSREADQAREEYKKLALGLSEKRKTAAQKLDQLVQEELKPLKLEKAAFVTQIEDLEETQWSAAGMNAVQFLVSTNPGSAPGALNKIASGGEMARFMLALKVILAEIGVAGTLVFDEVDSGIGGSTADAVGERLGRLAKHKQILVVTHSPQVAARAGHHWIVSKGGQEAVTTNVIALPEKDQRREEIARMLSGATITTEARAAAEKLLEGSAA